MFGIWVGFSAIYDITRLGNAVDNHIYALLGHLTTSVLPYGYII